MDPPPTPYKSGLWRAGLAVVVGVPVLAVAYGAGLLVAYGLAQGSIAGAAGAEGSSYLADDLHAVLRRSVTTMVVSASIWPLVHHYGRRGPLAAALFALGVGFVGFQSIANRSGPLDLPGQYLAYAGPVLIALMIAWRVAYRYVPLPVAEIYEFRPASKGER